MWTPCCIDPCEALSNRAEVERVVRSYIDSVTPGRPKQVCAVADCGNFVECNGYCVKHLRRKEKYGDPLAVFGKGPGSAEGSINAQGYRSWYVPGRGRVMEHRIVMEQAIGRELTDEETVHHRDTDKLHCCLANLELWSSRHVPGARVEDTSDWCIEFLRRYRPEVLADAFLSEVS